ncbi:hypothetical protein DFQ26_009632 [Actinomortierella ambigua]|nr:hypothetical protein DFQ26_009632 [Actinomortierella ambigua]
MNLTGQRSGGYQSLAGKDSEIEELLETVIATQPSHASSSSSDAAVLPTTVQRKNLNAYYSDSEDYYEDDNSSTYSDHDEKHYARDSEAVFQEPPKLTRGNRACLAFLGLLLVIWVGVAVVLGIARLNRLVHMPMEDMRPFFEVDDMFNTSFSPKYDFLAWMPIGADGVYSRIDSNGDIVLTNVDGSEPKVFLPGANVTDANNEQIDFFAFRVSPDEKFVLLSTQARKQWRHSFNATYLIYDMSTYKVRPLLEHADEPLVEHVTWSPVGHTLAYVQNNNLYVYEDLTTRHQVTFDGAPGIFNGLTDWVYEEEVYTSTNALWWSPDGTALAFLRFDETEVPEFHFPIFMNNQKQAPAYPRDIMMKYPKAGYPNPIVSLHIHRLKAGAGAGAADAVPVVAPTAANPLKAVDLSYTFAATNMIIAEVKWATVDSSALLVKVQNRVQNHEKVVLVDPAQYKGKVIREWDAGKEDGGWIDMQQSYYYIAPSKFVPEGGYLDIGNNAGYNHLALYTPVDNPQPKWLTNGEWEVSEVSAVDEKLGKVYFISAEKSSMERHLYSATLDTAERRPMTSLTEPGYYSASFSTGAGYYLLSYRGPEVPWQKVKKVGDEKFNMDLETNSQLEAAMKEKQLPTRRWGTVDLGGERECNYMEFLPPGFNPAEKHPVLFQVYGGPGSQLVDTQFQLGFSAVMSAAEKLRYVVVVVDGRGTGYKGRKFRIPVVNQLGKLETEDQILAGKHWSTLPYVDHKRLAIWGWSYGGFMATKVTEADAGVFSAAMAVAPVTDFRFYDAVYTERYMNLPSLNAAGYEATAVTNMTGFENLDYFLVHGTGDDNVHVQNTYSLIDRLTVAGNHRYKLHVFTDSDHSIRAHNANHEIYWRLSEFLYESIGGYVEELHHH